MTDSQYSLRDGTFGSNPPITWEISLPELGASLIGMAAGLKLAKPTNLAPQARTLPEGFIVCDAGICGGLEHIRLILLQAAKSWKDGLLLARSRSLDLLMRMTVSSQIDAAIRASMISDSSEIALLGLTDSQDTALSTYIHFMERLGDCVSRQDLLLDLNSVKAERLSSLHSLGPGTNGSLIAQLVEMSSLLNVR